MTIDDAVKSLLRARGLLDPNGLERKLRVRRFNSTQPQPAGRIHNVPCSIIEPKPPGHVGGDK